MPNTLTLFTAFANPGRDLYNLAFEQNGIQDALAPLVAAGKIQHLHRTDTDLEAYFKLLRQWENQICIFHYSGHASSTVLALQQGHAIFEPLAKELLAKNRKSLQLVFLNGCSTYAHVKILFDLGTPSVIATAESVDDRQAAELAVHFYKNLAAGNSIEDAFKSAAHFLQASDHAQRFRDLDTVQTWRGIAFRGKEFPWGLYVREGHTLPKEPMFEAQQSGLAEGKPDIHQYAEKIYNIDKIDNANFS